jgi:hypothetical protein
MSAATSNAPSTAMANDIQQQHLQGMLEVQKGMLEVPQGMLEVRAEGDVVEDSVRQIGASAGTGCRALRPRNQPHRSVEHPPTQQYLLIYTNTKEQEHPPTQQYLLIHTSTKERTHTCNWVKV